MSYVELLIICQAHILDWENCLSIISKISNIRKEGFLSNRNYRVKTMRRHGQILESALDETDTSREEESGSLDISHCSNSMSSYRPA